MRCTKDHEQLLGCGNTVVRASGALWVNFTKYPYCRDRGAPLQCLNWEPIMLLRRHCTEFNRQLISFWEMMPIYTAHTNVHVIKYHSFMNFPIDKTRFSCFSLHPKQITSQTPWPRWPLLDSLTTSILLFMQQNATKKTGMASKLFIHLKILAINNCLATLPSKSEINHHHHPGQQSNFNPVTHETNGPESVQIFNRQTGIHKARFTPTQHLATWNTPWTTFIIISSHASCQQFHCI